MNRRLFVLIALLPLGGVDLFLLECFDLAGAFARSGGILRGPLLFADPQAGIIGAAHAGWRGLARVGCAGADHEHA